VTRPVRVGVVGLGSMGRTHLGVLRSLGDAVSVVAVADVDGAAVERAVDGTQARGWSSGLDLLGSADLDGVVVASPDPTHAELVDACLERGLPVLCEKPLTTSVADSAELVEQEAALGRRLVQVGFMRRYDPAFADVAHAVLDGRVGTPAVVRTVHRNPVTAYAFQPSTLTENSASHDVDLLRWVTGDDVAEVSCLTAAGADEQFAAVHLRARTRGGVVASTELVYGPIGYDVGLEVVGRSGVVGTPPEGPTGHWTERFDEAYRRQGRAWVRSVASGTPDPDGATALDGLAVSRVLEAAERSRREGGAVIPLRAADPFSRGVTRDHRRHGGRG
jgi:myo-inositol 2-dehydrogenase / D-chiro-inositol 1-dehydrogenase